VSSLGSKSNKQIDVTTLVFDFGSMIGSLMMINAELEYIMKRLPSKKSHPFQKTQHYQLDEILDLVMLY
jgi:flagellar biogenesis protein FliO